MPWAPATLSKGGRCNQDTNSLEGQCTQAQPKRFRTDRQTHAIDSHPADCKRVSRETGVAEKENGVSTEVSSLPHQASYWCFELSKVYTLPE